jgi:uncharacterized RDD family membrane protein YckC
MMTGTSGGPYARARLDARLAAHILDTAFVFGLWLVAISFAGKWGTATNLIGGWIGLLLTLCVHPAYYILWPSASGRTIGKAIAGIAVRTTSGTPMSTKVAALRYCGYLLSILTGGAGHLAVFFTHDRRALQDCLAKTIVVQRSAKPILVRAILFAVAGLVCLVSGVIIFHPAGCPPIERSRESWTKGNLNSLISAISIYYDEHKGAYPVRLSTDPSSDFSRYMEFIPPVKATHAGVGNGTAESPSGTEVFYTTDESITVKGRGWRYNPRTGRVFVNSCATDSRGVPHSCYGY